MDMDLEKKRELLACWKAFQDSLPPTRVLRKAGLDEEDIVLQKQYNNGVPGYLALMDVPLWGGGVEVPDYNLKDWAKKFCEFFRNLWRQITK